MSARQPRFEVVCGDAGWFARFRAANGRIVWVTETYQRQRKAVHAVDLIVPSGEVYYQPSTGRTEVRWGRGFIEVRTVDERTAVTS